MKGNKGFTNKAKSGSKALPARWHQAIAKAQIEKQTRVRPKRKG